MPDLSKFSPEMQQYFNSLPAIVQETMKQSDLQVNSLDDLRQCAENLMRGA